MRYRNPLALAATGVALSLLGSAAVPAQTPTPVVASFSILGDMAERIGGPQVDVVTLVGPGGDAHVYQPTPQAAQAVSDAELFIVNGLQFEGWLDRLVDASDFTGQRVVVTDGIEPIAFGEAADAPAGHGDHGHDDHGHDQGTIMALPTRTPGRVSPTRSPMWKTLRPHWSRPTRRMPIASSSGPSATSPSWRRWTSGFGRRSSHCQRISAPLSPPMTPSSISLTNTG